MNTNNDDGDDGGAAEFNYGALIDEAISASTERCARNRARTQRLRVLVRQVHASPSNRRVIEQGLGLSPETVTAVLAQAETERASPMPAGLAAIMRDDDDDDDDDDEEAGAGGGAAARPTQLLAGTPATPGVGARAALAAAGRGGKRVASAGRRDNAATPRRRPRLAGGESDGGNDTPPVAAGGASGARGVVAPPPASDASSSGVVEISAASAATAEAIAVPSFVVKARPSGDAAAVDYLARAPADLVAFASRLMSAVDNGSSSSSSSSSSARGATMTLLCAMAAAFDDASLLAEQMGGISVLAPNRALIKGDERLLALGLGACFTSVALFKHDGGASAPPASMRPVARTDRAVGTTVITVFFDPEHVDGGGGGGGEDRRRQHAFELVYGGTRRFQLRHGAVLVSRAGGKPWTVVPAAAAGGSGSTNKKMCELRFFASRRVASLVGGAAAAAAAAAAGGEGEGDGAADHAASVIERLVADGLVPSRAEALALFARV
jgi:hypothetical protein